MLAVAHQKTAQHQMEPVGCASPRCKAKAVKVQQQDLKVGKEAVEVHGPVDRHHANDANALQQAYKHPKGARRSEEHRSLRRDLRCHGVVGNREEKENAHNADGLGHKGVLRVSTAEGARNIINTFGSAGSTVQLDERTEVSSYEEMFGPI